MKRTFIIIGCICALAVIVVGIFAWRYWISPSLRGLSNTVDYRIQKMDDATLYATRKKVEDTCRAMISSYNTDKLTYEQYRDSDDKEKQNWAEEAKMRANKTASTYNNYILDNSFIWEGNVPADINQELNYLT